MGAPCLVSGVVALTMIGTSSTIVCASRAHGEVAAGGVVVGRIVRSGAAGEIMYNYSARPPP